MGLLDDLLGQLAGAPSGRATDPRQTNADAPDASAGTSGMAQVMIALLPVVLGMLTARQRGQSPGAPQGGGGGGLGDILGQMLGGSARGSGGLGELLEQFQRAGFPDQVRSWVGTGQNLPIPPEAVENVFGPGGLAEIARRAGVSEKDASRGLSELMPEVVDRMTPDGQLPDDSALLASVDSLVRRLGAR
jgi:uncharacterized protein YidB (DUF937 family)